MFQLRSNLAALGLAAGPPAELPETVVEEPAVASARTSGAPSPTSGPIPLVAPEAQAARVRRGSRGVQGQPFPSTVHGPCARPPWPQAAPLDLSVPVRRKHSRKPTSEDVFRSLRSSSNPPSRPETPVRTRTPGPPSPERPTGSASSPSPSSVRFRLPLASQDGAAKTSSPSRPLLPPSAGHPPLGLPQARSMPASRASSFSGWASETFVPPDGVRIPLLLGVTNPHLVRMLPHFPNVFVLGDDRPPQQQQQGQHQHQPQASGGGAAHRRTPSVPSILEARPGSSPIDIGDSVPCSKVEI